MALSIEEDTRLGFDVALRALVPVPDRIEAGRRVGLCLAWVVLLRLCFSMLFRCCFMLKRRFRA